MTKYQTIINDVLKTTIDPLYCVFRAALNPDTEKTKPTLNKLIKDGKKIAMKKKIITKCASDIPNIHYFL